MGTGKTTVGKLLAKKLNRQFIDTDQLIEERQGHLFQRFLQIWVNPSFVRWKQTLPKNWEKRRIGNLNREEFDARPLER